MCPLAVLLQLWNKVIRENKEEEKQTIIIFLHENWKSPKVIEPNLQLNAIVSDKRDLIFWLSCFRKLNTVYVSMAATERKLSYSAEWPRAGLAINECNWMPLSIGKERQRRKSLNGYSIVSCAIDIHQKNYILLLPVKKWHFNPRCSEYHIFLIKWFSRALNGDFLFQIWVSICAKRWLQVRAKIRTSAIRQ